MTTTTYIVAYPHPSIHELDRACACEVDSRTRRKGLLSQLYEEYPRLTEDLKEATLWRVSRCQSKI